MKLIIALLVSSTTLANETDLVVHTKSFDQNQSQIQLSLFDPPGEQLDFFLKGDAEWQTRSVNLQPVSVWFDQSTLCAELNFPKHYRQLTSRLATLFPKQTTQISVTGFSSQGIKRYVTNDTYTAASEVPVECLNKAKSQNLEKIIPEAIKGLSAGSQIWFFLSGNIHLNKKTVASLKPYRVNVLFYKKQLYETLKPYLARYPFRSDYFTSSKIPGIGLSLDFPTDLYEAGTSKNLQLILKSDGQEVAKTTFAVQYPRDPRAETTRRILTLLLFLFAAVAVVLAARSMIRFYRIEKCGSCRRTIRKKDGFCWFCEKESAYLVNPDAQSVNRISEKGLVLRTAGSGELSIPHKKGLPRGRFLIRQTDESTYEMINLKSDVSPFVLVQGVPVYGRRVLASGDQIQIGSKAYRFYIRKESSHEKSLAS